MSDVEVAAQLEQLAASHRGSVRLIRPNPDDPAFVIARLGRGDDVEARPAILLVAGFDGRMVGATNVAIEVAAGLLAAEGDALDRSTIYVAPAVIPESLANGRIDAGDDADHDGRIDEDPPADVNGDGRILTMRIADPSPLSGLVATHVVDADDRRVVRPAGDDEVATHAVMVEGRDADGDGRFAEDGPGGIDLGRHFPARWPEFSDGAGRWPLDHGRARALADWVLATPSLVATIVYDHGASATATPVTRGNDVTGRIPLGILGDDEADHKTLVDAYRESTEVDAGERAARRGGSFDAWSYGHLGLWSLATPLWDRPDRMGPLTAPEAPDSGDGEGGTSGGPEDDPAGEMAGEVAGEMATNPDEADTERSSKKANAPDSDEAAWLEWTDRMSADADRGAESSAPQFTEWTAFDHPQLGPVEIGGFDPRLSIDLPASLVTPMAERQVAFVLKLVDHLPRVEILRTERRSLGGGLHEVGVVLRNVGRLPTRSAMGVRARRVPPIRVHLSDGGDPATIVSGRRLIRIDRLAADETRTMTWVVRTDDPGALRVTVEGPVAGQLDASLDAANGG
ncbi:MAG: hypothetical protein AB8G96_06155 [Phycisphaerales bacterium]